VGLLEEIDAVIQEVREAKPVPLSASAMINKKGLLQQLERIRRNAPEELKQARWVVQDRQGLLSGAQAEIDKMKAEAQVERDRMVARTEIVAAASREADKIIDEAKNRARQIRMEAEDYVDAKLASFEVVLHKTLSAVTRGRESLRGRLDVAGQQVPMDEPGELAVLPSDTGSFRRI
jgi:cell division septum initiation protein DivIVA